MIKEKQHLNNAKNYGMRHVLLGLIVLFGLIFILGKFSGSDKITQTNNYQTPTVQSNTPVHTITIQEPLRQKSIREFLEKEILLDDELQQGNNEVEKAGYEFDYGVPLPYIIKAEIIFENVLKESKALVAPVGGEKVKTYLVETTSGFLSGIRTIKEGLESYPVNKTKFGQGLEILNKAQTSYARKNAEIARLKNEFGIK